jgi:hypothetical protein
MFCNDCGASNPDSAKFCSQCGKPLLIVAPGSAGPSPATAPLSTAPVEPLPQAAADRSGLINVGVQSFVAENRERA